ncbi:hypothetical protein [Geodermatophilus sp. DSM 44513]|uniref:hypothetical protein n=1 Tax=Geodermatophilus sp. DSM 44513 TaxID=1528104 RepID=UPI00126C6DB9|nr:hypothetical protein [Geodermatophilus sp. DSM 44513]WNV76620.1 hypothetical protein RTG05_04935 [Geodermatophilus sp. DSM 44513]
MLDSNPIPTRPAPAGERPGGPALAVRRWALVAAPALAGLCAVVAAAADPAAGRDGAALVVAYAENPGPLQVKSVAYHFSYALWGVTALWLALLVRRRGAWTADLALLLAFLGATSVPGFLVVDFYDSAIGQTVGLDGDARIQELLAGMWGMSLLQTTGVAGLLLCLPVAALAGWRAGFLTWWAPAGVTLGIFGGFMLVGATVPGALVMTAGFAVLSVDLARSAGRWDPPPAAA